MCEKNKKEMLVEKIEQLLEEVKGLQAGSIEELETLRARPGP